MMTVFVEVVEAVAIWVLVAQMPSSTVEVATFNSRAACVEAAIRAYERDDMDLGALQCRETVTY